MKKPIAAFELYCDGCGDIFEAWDSTIFTSDWPFDEEGWVAEGDIELCNDCHYRLLDLADWFSPEPPLIVLAGRAVRS